MLYVLAAFALWPGKPGEPGDRSPAFPAAGRIGERTARIGWLALWGLLAWVMLRSANRAPDAVRDAITGGGMEGMAGDQDMANAGAPSWLAWLDGHAGNLAAGRGLGIAIGLAAVFALIGLCVFAPWRRAVTVGLAAAIVLCAVIWVLGEGLGMPYQGMATDPNSAPLLALLAAAFWPTRRGGHVAAAAGAARAAEVAA